ncbi:hypothetical protein [Streptomyces sp. NPDC014623]|uniref:hypothetical protein n=1 Tax=Streptomyces sp. NPDC014623 TaxID=3364875 RepID=UPI00370001E6
MTTHRHPLGAGPDPADNPELSPGPDTAPRAGLAAQHLPSAPAADDEVVLARPTGRRVLGTGPTAGR